MRTSRILAAALFCTAAAAAQAQTGGGLQGSPGSTQGGGAQGGVQPGLPSGGNMPPMTRPASPNDAEHAPTRSMQSTLPNRGGSASAGAGAAMSDRAGAGMQPGRGRGIWHGDTTGDESGYPR